MNTEVGLSGVSCCFLLSGTVGRLHAFSEEEDWSHALCPAGRREAHILYLFSFPSLVWGNLRYSYDGKIRERLTIYIWCFRRHNDPNMYHQICPIKLVVNLTSMFLLVFKSPGVSSGTRLFCHWSELAFWRIMLCLCVIVLRTPCWKLRSPPSRSAASHFLSLLFMIYGSDRG